MLLSLFKSLYIAPIRLVIRLVVWAMVLLMIVVTIFALTFDLNGFKEKIESQASGFLLQPVRVGGDILLGIENFRPSLVLHDVEIGAAGKGGVWTIERLEVTIPMVRPGRDVEFSLESDIDGVVYDGRRLGDFEAPIRIAGNGVALTDISGRLDGAKLTGNVSYLGETLKAEIQIKDLDYAHVAEGIRDGELQVTAQLHATGVDESALRRSLAGSILIEGGEGEMAGDAINLWAADLLSSVLSGPAAETKLNCAVAEFAVEGGVAKSRRLVIDTPRVTVTGKGSINIVRETASLTFTPRPKERALLSLATPVIVSGPLDDLSVQPQPAAMAQKLGGLLLGAVNPAAALLPLMEQGAGDNDPCGRKKK